MKHKKSLGQHFLKDQIILDEIAESANINQDDCVWEIGPGTGYLTDHLIKRNIKPLCFEVDKDLWPYLREKYKTNIDLIEKDILKVNWKEYLQDKQVKIVANLPYQITSPFLFKVIDHYSSFDLLVVMIQKEVAKRICSLPDKKDYGILSLKIQYYYNAEILFNVGPEKFDPPPKVDSSVIRLTPRKNKPEIEDLKLFWRIVETAFRTRRKMLRNNLRSFKYSIEFSEIDKKSPIDFNRRGETLSEADFICLYDFLRPFIVG